MPLLMQPNLLRNLCFLPTKNKKYRTFYRTHFLLISITCLSRYISLSFSRPALAQMITAVNRSSPYPDQLVDHHLETTSTALNISGDQDTFGTFPLHGAARYGSLRFTFGGFSTGYCTWYLVLFSTTSAGVPSDPYRYQNMMCKLC